MSENLENTATAIENQNISVNMPTESVPEPNMSTESNANNMSAEPVYENSISTESIAEPVYENSISTESLMEPAAENSMFSDKDLELLFTDIQKSTTPLADSEVKQLPNSI